MKNKFILGLILFGSFTLQAQLLWKVSGKGLKQPSYLFGTYHLISIQYLDSIPGLYKAFNSCNTVVGELVFSNVDAMAKIQQASIMPKHIKMTDLLSDDNYKLVDLELKSVMKTGLKQVAMMNPSLILSLYKLELYKKLTGFSDDVESDSYFQLVAAEKGKEIVGLETIDQQIESLYGNGSLDYQAGVLLYSIQHKDSVLNDMIHLNKLYKAGKIDQLVELTNKKGIESNMTKDEKYTNFIDKRNNEWIQKLPQLFKASSSFVAVDVLHLGGKNGLIKLLEKEGYRVTAVAP